MSTYPLPIATDCNVRDQYKEMTIEAVQAAQKVLAFPYAAAVINLNGDLNLGMMLRSAVIFGVSKFYIFGNKKYDKRSTVGAHNYIDIVSVKTEIILTKSLIPTIEPNILYDTLKNDKFYPIFVEQGGRDISRFKLNTIIHDDLHPCFVFGNEGYGISPDILKWHENGTAYPYLIPHILTIPQVGVMRSLNVAAAASIVFYEMAKTTNV